MQGSKQLIEKLQAFNPNLPYIWQMRLTKADYGEIAGIIAGKRLDLTTKDDALLSLVYIAEWYKREYTNRNKDGYKTVFGGGKPDLQQIWDTLGIDQKFLYEGETGKLRLYSTFILGGLAVKFELQKNEEGFLKALCRLYNKQDISFENVAKSNQSIAFRQSITDGHCLSEYFDAVLSTEDALLPFAETDLADSTTRMRDLVETVRTINDMVNKSKFRLEWLVVKSDDVLVRSIRFWLNPEEKGRLHQILRCDRLNRWGMSNPEELHYVYIGLRFKNGNKVVEDTCQDKAVFSYRNTGNPEVGFIAEVEHFKHITNVPVSEFDKVEIVTWDKDGSELVVQEETIDFSAIQLFREEDGQERWTSRTQSQKETVVMFSDAWALSESSVDKFAERLTLYNKRYSDGIVVNWCEIHSSVTIEKGENEIMTFFNRIGHDYISTRTYDNTIQYIDSNKVALFEYDEESGVNVFDSIPLVFSKDDIVCYHCQKNDDEEEVFEEINPELLEYKVKGGFELWEEDSPVAYGKTRVRATIKGKQQTLDVFYAPGTIIRDCDNHKIHYVDFLNGDEVTIDESEEIATVISYKERLQPTTKIRLGNELTYVEVEVYRPTNLKEICFDGRMTHSEEADTVCIPYILKNDIVVNLYGDFGYISYECSRLGNIYPLLGDMSNAHLSAWEHTQEFEASRIDAHAPDCLRVKFGDKYDESRYKRLEYYYWNYSSDVEPRRVKYGITPEKNTIVFQSLSKLNPDLANIYPKIVSSPFGNKAKADCLKCFEVATIHKVHYFAFKPLLILERDKKMFVSEIYEPLVKKRNGNLETNDIKGLRRLAEEFKFDWEDFNIDLDK